MAEDCIYEWEERNKPNQAVFNTTQVQTEGGNVETTWKCSRTHLCM